MSVQATQRYDGEPIDVVKAFAPFTEDELQRLYLFSQHVSDIDELDIPQRPKLTLSLTGGVGGGPVMENINKDVVHAVVIAYRKFVSEKDPANFNRVRNLIGRHAENADTEDSARVHAWMKNIEGYLEQVRQGPAPPSSDEDDCNVLRPPQAIDWLINGVVAHSDPERRAYWEALGGWNNHAMVWLAVSAITEELRAFRYMASMARMVLATPELHA
jgi:hypothetical protein